MNALEQVLEEAQISNVIFTELQAHVHIDVRGWPSEKLARYIRRYRRLISFELVGVEAIHDTLERRVVIRVPKNGEATATICW